MRAEVNRGQILNKFKNAKDLVEEAKAESMRKAAAWVVLRSPVDTGTYMENHNIGEGNSVPASSIQSSFGRPKVDYGPVSQASLNNMYAQIDRLPEDWKRASIANTAFHSEEVEYTHGYGVYTSLRAAWPQLKAEAVAEAEARSKT